MNQINNILITGGAGFIGSNLVKRLVNKNCNITIIDNLERGRFEYIENVSHMINFINADLRNYDEIKDLFKNQDCVIHLASKVGGIGKYVTNPYEIMQSNILIDSNVLKAVVENNIEKYFYASSAHVYPKSLQTTKDSPSIYEFQSFPANPELSYGWAKLIGELLIQAAMKEHKFLNVAIVRFIGIYGPNQDFNLETGSVIPVFSHRVLKHPNLNFDVWGTGQETRSYCYIEDTLDCVELILDKMSEIKLVGPLNVGKEERFTISEIANILIKISGKDIKINYDTTKNTVIWGQLCNCNKVKELLGWEAKTSIEDGIKQVYNDIKNRLKNHE